VGWVTVYSQLSTPLRRGGRLPSPFFASGVTSDPIGYHSAPGWCLMESMQGNIMRSDERGRRSRRAAVRMMASKVNPVHADRRQIDPPRW